jgi:phospholipid/cholesterol/gamma-HCH transport system permease protein
LSTTSSPPASAALANGPGIERQLEGEHQVLYLTGSWRLAALPALADVLPALRLQAAGHVILDGSRLDALDTAAGFVLLRHLADRGCADAMLTSRGFEPRHERLLTLVRERMTAPPAIGRSARPGLLQSLGVSVVGLARLLRTHTAFVGALALEVGALLRRPRLFRVRETVSQFQAVCIDAIPIVALVNCLIGVVIAYVLGVEAQRYGANLFVADGSRSACAGSCHRSSARCSSRAAPVPRSPRRSAP